MRRFHLFEFEDQSWFPEVIRSAMMAYLRFVAEAGGHAEHIAPVLRRVLDRSGSSRIIDLGSGGGGPAVPLLLHLRGQGLEVDLVLTDLYPNRVAMETAVSQMPDAIRAVLEPVDATDVGGSLVGVRSFFNSLHHFRPEAARCILEDAVDSKQPVVIMEMLGKNPLVLISTLLSFLPVMLLLPFFRPFRWSWLIWTYLLPVIPLATVWDGSVSWLRIYSEAELRKLIESVPGQECYEWEIGRLALSPLPMAGSYLIGIPRS